MFITRHKNKIRILCRILFCAYMILLVYFLFFSEKLGRIAGTGEYRYNLILFREIRRFWIYRSQIGLGTALLNLAGNVLIFVPFGFFWPTMSARKRRRRGLSTVWLGFLLSLTVECVQLLTKCGSFDVDDLLLNTLGALAGYLLYAGIQHYRDRKAQLFAEGRVALDISAAPHLKV